MRILYCGITGRHSSDIYRIKGFSQYGMNVYSLDYRRLYVTGGIELLRDSMLHIIYSFQPDIVFVNKGEKFTAKVIKQLKQYFPNVLWFLFYGDMREKPTPYMKSNALVYDALLINADDEKYFEMYRNIGVKKIFYYHTATDTNVFKKDFKIPEKYDIGFFGGNYYGSFPDSVTRYEIIEALLSRYNVLIHGTAWGGYGKRSVYGEDYAKAASSCKLLLGASNFSSVHKYTSNRTWNSMANGCVVHYYFNGIEEFFKNNYHLVWFKKPSEMFRAIDYLLENPDERKRVYSNGRKLIKEQHTYKKRAEELFKIFMEVKHD